MCAAWEILRGRSHPGPFSGETFGSYRQEQRIYCFQKGVEVLVQESHSLRLTERKSLSVTGVTEVVRFDEDAVVLQTDMGTLTVQGEQLQLKELSVEGGRVTVEGTISALSYEAPRQSGSFLQRLLG